MRSSIRIGTRELEMLAFTVRFSARNNKCKNELAKLQTILQVILIHKNKECCRDKSIDIEILYYVILCVDIEMTLYYEQLVSLQPKTDLCSVILDVLGFQSKISTINH